VEVVACEFETAVVDVLVAKTIRAAKEFKVKSILLGGGVSANTQLRHRLDLESKNISVPFFKPELRLCGDNASSVASAAFYNFDPKPFSEISADPSLSIT